MFWYNIGIRIVSPNTPLILTISIVIYTLSFVFQAWLDPWSYMFSSAFIELLSDFIQTNIRCSLSSRSLWCNKLSLISSGHKEGGNIFIRCLNLPLHPLWYVNMFPRFMSTLCHDDKSLCSYCQQSHMQLLILHFLSCPLFAGIIHRLAI